MIYDKKLHLFADNYDTYKMTRQSQETALIRNIIMQTKKGEHMHSFVDRFWAKETKAKQAKIDWKCSCCVACHIFIGRCDLPYDFVSKNQKEQSYKACMELKRKALFIKLRHLIRKLYSENKLNQK